MTPPCGPSAWSRARFSCGSELKLCGPVRMLYTTDTAVTTVLDRA